MSDPREQLALTRGEDPYDSEVARKAAALDLLDEEDQETADRVEVQRRAVLGRSAAEMARELGVGRHVIKADLAAIKAANQRRFNGTTPRELAAQFEAGFDFIIARGVAMAEEAKNIGDAEGERESLKLAGGALKDKFNTLKACGLVMESNEPTEEDKKREAARAQLGEQAKDILLDALMSKLRGGNAPVQVALTVEAKESEAAPSAEAPTAT